MFQKPRAVPFVFHIGKFIILFYLGLDGETSLSPGNWVYISYIILHGLVVPEVRVGWIRPLEEFDYVRRIFSRYIFWLG